MEQVILSQRRLCGVDDTQLIGFVSFHHFGFSGQFPQMSALLRWVLQSFMQDFQAKLLITVLIVGIIGP